jgi:hypothetical protein
VKQPDVEFPDWFVEVAGAGAREPGGINEFHGATQVSNFDLIRS